MPILSKHTVRMKIIIKHICSFLLIVPFDESLDIYQEYFEKQFLQEMQDFYRLEATTYIHVQNRPVMEYLSKVSSDSFIKFNQTNVFFLDSSVYG